MLRIIIFSLVVFSGSFEPGQPDINYKHKRLLRELEKKWAMLDPVMEEITIPGSMRTEEPLQGKFFTLKDANYQGLYHYIYIGRVNSCRAGGCSVSLDMDVYGDSEYFDYFILLDQDLVVEQVGVFNYQATHGQEVSVRGWLGQFDGYNGNDPLVVGKNIDAISGATISVYGITLDVQAKTRLLRKLVL